MIRIQIFCNVCNQLVEATISARRGRMIASTFEEMHLSDECMKEASDGGQDQAGAGSGGADEGAVQTAPKAVSEGPPGRPH